MADSNVVEKPLLEKIQDLLERKSGHYDVTFCVGKEKKIVRALKIVLKASSPFLEKEFEEKWELAVIKEGEGIPLPDFDPTAFELFVKLTSLDTWSRKSLKKLKLPSNNILNLLTICRRLEMNKAVENLEKLAKTFMQSFRKYKETNDFLQLSQTNLKSVLVSDDIGIKELDVFHSAIRWADFQCKEMKIQPTDEHIREVLGDCLFQIRFPIMTNTEFTEATEAKDILTAEETVGIYKYIGLAARKQMKYNTKKLSFKTTQRKTTQAQESSRPKPKTYSSEALIPPGCSTLFLPRDTLFLKKPAAFACDGSRNNLYFGCGEEITVFGFGFLGPIENDGFYDVKIHVKGCRGITYDSGILEKCIYAPKGKKFYFFFDTPIDLEAISLSKCSKFYAISYYLEGPDTSAYIRSDYTTLNLHKGDIKFRLERKSNQLTEILYKLS